VDAVLVGIRTVLADDPQLTARDVPLRRRATRVVLDTHLRIPPRSSLVATAGDVPLLVMTSAGAIRARASRAAQLRKHGVELQACRLRRGRLDLADALHRLGQRRLTNVLVEGGGQVLGEALDRVLADEAYVFVAPALIGGADAVAACPGRGVARVLEARPARQLRTARLGPDLLLHFRLTPPD
jgi:diaminohydroxyphosphoribosylaminopyrimidine deaminase/5-amino-6-(5-phosphoribosylamino)uracil reductase